jgi:uroporphyrinogen-III decarboxylase
MPDPDQNDVLREAEHFIKTYQRDYALFANIRMGIAPTLLSMGYETFSFMLYEDREFIENVLALYLDFNKKFITNLESVGFDFLWVFDDIAFRSGPLFSPRVWDDVFLNPVSKVTRNIKIPWIYHSDGNLIPILERLLPLGMNGIHPLEPGTMDVNYLKTLYGKKLCLVGNIDINSTLSSGSPEEVDREVKERIEQLGPGGGYIISDSNSVPYFCKAENIIAMSRAVEKYRYIY